VKVDTSQWQTPATKEPPSHQTQGRAEQAEQKGRGLREEVWPRGRSGQIDRHTETTWLEAPPTVEASPSVAHPRSGQSGDGREEEKTARSGDFEIVCEGEEER